MYANVGCTLAFPDGTLIPFGHVPVIPCDGWSKSKRRAYVIADNKLALNAGWDSTALTNELRALLEEEFDLGLIGMSAAELASMFPTAPEEFGAIDDDLATEHTCPKCGYQWSGGNRKATADDDDEGGG